jgi:hypothetical protein
MKLPPPLLDRKENAARMRSAENIQGGEFLRTDGRTHARTDTHTDPCIIG